GKETPHKFERAKLEEVLKKFVDSDNILRSKGMVESTDGTWLYFDMVPGEYEIREGEPDYTGRIVVIGTEIHEDELLKTFGL
ncbi:MAG: GTP-binding protein, partial [Lachnospiraceae bacterium]|nr:GTP-binding protein [Lachnospiraceae bacterium]